MDSDEGEPPILIDECDTEDEDGPLPLVGSSEVEEVGGEVEEESSEDEEEDEETAKLSR